MPVTINSQTYYRTTEVCRMVGISRNTLFRWLKEGSLTGLNIGTTGDGGSSLRLK